MKRARRNPQPTKFLEHVIDNDDDPIMITWTEGTRLDEPGVRGEYTLMLGRFLESGREVHFYGGHAEWDDREKALMMVKSRRRVDFLLRGSEIKISDDDLRHLGIKGRMILGEMVTRLRELLGWGDGEE